MLETERMKMLNRLDNFKEDIDKSAWIMTTAYSDISSSPNISDRIRTINVGHRNWPQKDINCFKKEKITCLPL